MMKKQMRSPWAWIPTLYLAEGLPYVAVMTLSVILYKRLGISNTDIALYTSWLYLPWVIKPFWSPFVDLLKTKRWWIISMQLLLGAGFAGIAFTIPVSFFFQATLAFFWLMAFSSATHDIAADGFYMLALDHNQQALYVGIRSTFYRVATILGQGLLIILAGWLESATGPDPVKIDVEVSPQYTCGTFALPKVATAPAESTAALSFVVSQPTVTLGTAGVSADSVRNWVGRVEDWNRSHGFLVEEEAGAQGVSKTETSWWTRRVSRPLGEWLRTHFGERRDVEVTTDRAGDIGIAAVSLSREPDPDEEVVLNMTMNRGDRSVSPIGCGSTVRTGTNRPILFFRPMPS